MMTLILKNGASFIVGSETPFRWGAKTGKLLFTPLESKAETYHKTVPDPQFPIYKKDIQIAMIPWELGSEVAPPTGLMGSEFKPAPINMFEDFMAMCHLIVDYKLDHDNKAPWYTEIKNKANEFSIPLSKMGEVLQSMTDRGWIVTWKRGPRRYFNMTEQADQRYDAKMAEGSKSRKAKK